MPARCLPLMEPMEGRRLLSAAPANSVMMSAGLSVEKGVLTIEGTSGDDQIDVRKTAGGLAITRPLLLANGGSINNVVTVIYFGSDDLHTVVFNGGAGDDRLTVDTATQRMTYSRSVEQRLLSAVGRDGKRRLVDAPDTRAIPGVLRGDAHAWIDQSQAEIAAAPKLRGGALLLGDSHIRNFKKAGRAAYNDTFADVPRANLGQSGDTTSQLLYRLRNQGLLDRQNPAVVVLEIGTNNATLTDDAADIVAGIAAVLEEIRARLPDAQILLLSVLPRAGSANKIVARVNARLAALADDHVHFLDVTDHFTSAGARAKYFLPDQLHLTPRGYAAWGELIRPAVVGLMG